MEYQRLTFDNIVQDKQITKTDRLHDLVKLSNYPATDNTRCFAGNNFLYHHQMENLCKVRVNNKDSLFDKMIDEEKYKKLWANMIKLKRTGTIANKLFEANRFNNAVVFFKPTTAKWLYKKYNATSVLDPTAGWGGRMLGAWALDIPYTGFDTNDKMQPAYSQMVDDMEEASDILKKNCFVEMRFESCLTADFSDIEYDFVLTSPPYINLETYEMMTPFQSKATFYNEFLIPLLNKCLEFIKPSGWVAFNISPQMYSDLLKFGYRACDATEELLQQKRLGRNKEDKIYLWRK